MRFLLPVSFVAAAFTLPAPLMAAPGDLDTLFGTGGKVVTPIGPSQDYGRAVALQPDGKVLVAGYSRNGSGDYDFALARYNADGTLDTAFDGDGKVLTPVGTSTDMGYGILLQPDGKVLVGGLSDSGGTDYYDFALVRYNTDGSLDMTFDGDGKVVTPASAGYDWAYAIALQTDGKILVAGGDTHDFALVRFNSNGTLDADFGSGGKVITPVGSAGDMIYAITLQADGKILAAGSAYDGSQHDFALVRYNADGSLDPTFDDDGKAITPVGSASDVAYAMAIQPDGKILVAGYSRDNSGNDDFALVRYNTDGSLDTAFDGDGKLVTPEAGSNDYGQAVALQSDGQILLAGRSQFALDSDFVVVRYDTDGALDTRFGVDGKVFTSPGAGTSYDEAYSMVLQADGKLLVAGSSRSDFAVVRYIAVPTEALPSGGGGGVSDLAWLVWMGGMAAFRAGSRRAALRTQVHPARLRHHLRCAEHRGMLMDR